MKKILLLLLLPTIAFSQFGTGGTTKRIDKIENESQDDITLSPNADVIIDSLAGDKALVSGTLKEVEESSTTKAQIEFLNSLSSNVQDQLDGKEPTITILPIAKGGTGSATQNFVDLTTNQIIAGNKTVTGQFVATSTTNGNRPCPRMTGAERDLIGSPAEGDCVVNSSTDELNFYLNGTWGKVGGGTTMTTSGNIIGFDGALTKECVLDTTDGYILTRDSTADCNWDFKPSPVAVSVTTDGDLQGHDGVSPIRIPGGTDGDFAIYDTSVSGNIKWGNTLQGSLNPITNPTLVLTLGDFTTQGFGTPSGINMQWHREGSFLVYSGRFTTGTVSGSEAQITLPNGYTVSSLAPAGANVVGIYGRSANVANKGGFILASPGDAFVNFSGPVFSSATLVSTTPVGGNGIFNSAEIEHLEFKVRIEGWGSNVDAIAQNKTMLEIVADKGSAQGMINNSSTVITYVDSKDTHNAFASGIFTAPYAASFLVCPTFALTGTAYTVGDIISSRLELSVGTNQQISQDEIQETATISFFGGKCHKVEMVESETLSFSVFQNTGSTVNLSGNVTANTLTITELPSSAVIASAIDSQKWDCETKFLAGNTSVIGYPADLSFNVEVGKKYLYSGQMYLSTGALAQVRDNTTNVGYVFTNASVTSSRALPSRCIEASSTLLRIYNAAAATMQGNGTATRSYFQVCKLPDNYICN